jgi:cbb3-type cytochrome oxidase subunit 3
MAYNFLENSGVGETSKQIGYDKQSLFNSPDSLINDIGLVINIAFGLIGVIFFGLIFYGGWLWMTAAGNEDQAEKAKKIIIGGSVGLVIILAAYAISYLIAMAVSPATLR